MSTSAASSMPQRGPSSSSSSSQWRRLSSLTSSDHEPQAPRSRGYAVGINSKSQPPPPLEYRNDSSRQQQQHYNRDYYHNDGDQSHSYNINNDRRNGFVDRSNNERDNNNRGQQGYNANYDKTPVYNRRKIEGGNGMMTNQYRDGNSDNFYNGGNRSSNDNGRRDSSFASYNNSNRNNNYYDERRSVNGGMDRNDGYRDSGDRGDLYGTNQNHHRPYSQPQERRNDQYHPRNNPYPPQQERARNVNDGAYLPRHSTVVGDGRNNTYDHVNGFPRSEYNDRGPRHQQYPNRPEQQQRWSGARENDYLANHDNSNGFSNNHRPGDREYRERDWNSRGIQHQHQRCPDERRPAVRPERVQQRRMEANPGKDVVDKSSGHKDSLVHKMNERSLPKDTRDVNYKRAHSNTGETNIQDPPKKRPRDGTTEPLLLSTKATGSVTTKAEKTPTIQQQVPTKDYLKSSTEGSCKTETKVVEHARESKPAQVSQTVLSPKAVPPVNSLSSKGSIEVKQSRPELVKESKIASPSSTPKPNNTEVPKPSSSLAAKKPQQKPLPAKAKPTNKLGIPMRWLKPKAKPKPPPPPPKPKIVEDTSKTTKILKSETSKKTVTNHRPPSSPSNRLVTDSSEGGSSLTSTHTAKKSKVGNSVPTAIVTKSTSEKGKSAKRAPKQSEDVPKKRKDEWDSDAESEPEDNDSSDSDDDDEEVLHWASKMLGVQASSPSPVVEGTGSKQSSDGELPSGDKKSTNHDINASPKTKSPKLKIRLSAAMKIKLSESIKSNVTKNKDLSDEDSKKMQAALKKLERKKKRDEKLKALSEKINNEQPEFDHEKARLQIEEDRRKREEAKPLTAKEIRKILREDLASGAGDQSNWVRRSRRQPNMALLNSKPVRVLVEKLKNNDTDMRVLKMKKYINDPNAPCAVLDAILCALEENTNCEALYIQNFNEGMRDQQVLHLLRILQQASCKVWCLNIGENYNVSDETWEKFTKGLIHTKITHMYASEHTITTEMKDEIRFTIRENRKKHDKHINPNNLDVIVQCTHCWWNPINAKVLRPYLKNKGYEHILKDREAQGLQGTTSMAPST